ncbi:MAG: hypothetical protein ISS02_00880 [Candidatus Portnoybacteria bacterium]|nr:hypothetical protein [Candidatus Portnoybacteria bacterium]
MTPKKILIILIIVLLIVISILIGYNFFIKKDLPDDVINNTGSFPQSGGASPNTGSGTSFSGQIKPISQEPSLGMVIDGIKVKYYSVNNGNVFESNFDGSGLTRISSAVLTGLSKIIWSPDKNKTIAIFDNNGEIKKYFYDFNTQVNTSLDKDIRWVTWSSNGNKIAYQYYNSQNEDNNISTANPDGSQWKNILNTRMKNLIVEWPSSELVSIRTKPSGLAQSVIYTINLTDNKFEKILNEAYGFTVLWSPLGDKLLFSETDSQGKNLKLKIADLTQSTIKELSLATLPEKCVWSQDNRTIFCAIPKTISDLATLPDDYYKGTTSFNDDFWRINLDTEKVTKIFESKNAEATSYDAKELLLPPLENYLLFINQKDNLIYSLEL